MQKLSWERVAAILFTLCVGGILLLTALRYALPIVLPFAIAWGIALLIQKPSEALASRLSISKKLVSVLLLLLLLTATVWLIGASVRRLLLELQHLLERLLSQEDTVNAVGNPIDYFEMITSKIPFLRRIGAGERFYGLREGFNQAVSDFLKNLLESLSSAVPSLAAGLLSALPTILLSIVITVIAGFYFCIDGEGIRTAITSLLPSGLRSRLPAWKSRVKQFSKGYLRAYLLLFLLTFSELFLGFCLLRIEYAFLLALLISFVDLLPVLGVGAVLVPWSILLLLQKDLRLGLGLLILFGAVTVIRQIMEPRLLGKSLGLHPLFTLFASYAGWKLFGVAGMLLGPIIALAAKTLFDRTHTLGSRL